MSKINIDNEISPAFAGEVKGGKVVLDNRAKFIKHLSGLDGRRIQLIVKRWYKRRTGNANAYYWGVVVALIADHTGHVPDDVHTFLKAMFLKKKVMIGRKVIDIPASTSLLSTFKFGIYLEQVMAWASQELGIRFPSPDEFYQNE